MRGTCSEIIAVSAVTCAPFFTNGSTRFRTASRSRSSFPSGIRGPLHGATAPKPATADPRCARRFYGRCDLDVLWFPFNGASWDGFSIPSVATLHDAVTFVRPEYSEADRAPFRLAAQRCDRIITDSDFSKGELVRELHLPPARVETIPLGISDPLPVREVALDVKAFGRFVLLVGENDPRKGLDTLLAASTALQSEGMVMPVVVAGIPTAQSRTILEETRCPVHALGHVDDATLAALYRACTVFAYPSRYEGFGLPVLEAMSYGAPVVASSAGGIPEAGGDAALYVPPGDVTALAAALRSVANDPRLRPICAHAVTRVRAKCRGERPRSARWKFWNAWPTVKHAHRNRAHPPRRCGLTRGVALSQSAAAVMESARRPTAGERTAFGDRAARVARRDRLAWNRARARLRQRSYDGEAHFTNFTFAVDAGGDPKIPVDESDHVVAAEFVPVVELEHRIAVAVVREPLLAVRAWRIGEAGYAEAGISIVFPTESSGCARAGE